MCCVLNVSNFERFSLTITRRLTTSTQRRSESGNYTTRWDVTTRMPRSRCQYRLVLQVAAERYVGMSVDDAKELKELRTENSKLKRLVAEAELEKMMLREIAKGKFSARLAQQRNAELFCCSKTLLGHQNGLRAKLLGSPGQSSAGL